MKSKTLLTQIIKSQSNLECFVEVDGQLHQINDVLFSTQGPTTIQKTIKAGHTVNLSELKALKEEKVKSLVITTEKQML
jgi:hypothetical protein